MKTDKRADEGAWSPSALLSSRTFTFNVGESGSEKTEGDLRGKKNRQEDKGGDKEALGGDESVVIVSPTSAEASLCHSGTTIRCADFSPDFSLFYGTIPTSNLPF